MKRVTLIDIDDLRSQFFAKGHTLEVVEMLEVLESSAIVDVGRGFRVFLALFELIGILLVDITKLELAESHTMIVSILGV